MESSGKTPRPARLESSAWIQAVDGAAWRLPALAAAIAGVALPWLTAKPLVDAAIPLLAQIRGADGLTQAGLRTAGLLLVVLGPLCLLAVLSMVLIERRAKAPHRSAPAPAALAGLILGAAGIALAVAATATTTPSRFVATTGSISGLGLAALLVLAQASGEELFFRAWLQPILAARWGVVVGLAATAVIFAVAHAAGGSMTPLSVLNDSLAGAVFGLLALRTGGLAAPLAAHFAWNYGEANLFGATPTADPFGSLLRFQLSGPALWTGGAEGLNGSLSDTAVLLVMLALVGAYRPAAAQS